ncbi:MAG: PD40 domain-containing protein [Chloroflexi bacterium]|nr:PD40 domain-containing protein [Chloroflexota bacterium]
MKLFRIAALLVVLWILGVGVSMAAGGGPGDAIYADGSAQTVAPHAELWFRFDYGGTNKEVNVTLDANDASALRLNIYTPQAIAAWQDGESLKKIGEGSPVQNHDLGWSGRFNFPGTFYAVVYNDGDAPMTVNVRATGEDVTTGKQTTAPGPTSIPNPFPHNTPVGKGIAGKLAFLDAQGGNLYTVNGDGTNLRRVSFGMDPQWNHAGTLIALARQGPTAGIFTVNADGSSDGIHPHERLLYATSEPRSPDWSPDDAQLVFARQTALKGGGTICFGARCFDVPVESQWKLGLLDASDGAYGDVPTTNHAFTPTWNPSDATKIAYNDKAIGVIVTSTDETPSFEPIIGDLRPGVGTYDPLKILSPQYSPDGKYIVLMVAQPPTWQIAIANADGSSDGIHPHRHLLTSLNNLDFTHANNVAPVWSPDGTKILFLSDRNQTTGGLSKWELFTMNADGSNVQQVLKNVSDQISLNYSYQGERMLSWAK